MSISAGVIITALAAGLLARRMRNRGIERARVEQPRSQADLAMPAREPESIEEYNRIHLGEPAKAPGSIEEYYRTHGAPTWGEAIHGSGPYMGFRDFAAWYQRHGGK